jgi:hypothetical protein
MTLDILREFAQQRATPEQVMRQLVTYTGWYAPLLWASDALNTEMFDSVYQWGDQSSIPADQLWLFTTPEAGKVALQRSSLGLYAGPLSGIELFEHIPQGVRAVEINPYSPPDQGWYVEGPTVEVARSWGRAMALERALTSGGPDTVKRLVEYDRYTILLTQQGSLAIAVGAAGMSNPGMLFTTGDAVDLAVAAFGPTGATLQRAVLGGHDLFSQFDRLGVDGFVLNIAGPMPYVLNAEVCKGLAASIEANAELARLEARAREAAEAEGEENP